MTNDNEAKIRTLEELPKNSLVLMNDTGEVLRRTAQPVGSRYEWVKLAFEEDSYYMFSSEVAAISHTIIWNPAENADEFDDELRELAKELSKRQWIAPGIPLNIPAQANTPAVPEIFKEGDYPRIVEAIKLKYLAPLNLALMNTPIDEEPTDNCVYLGSLHYQPGLEDLIDGNLSSSYSFGEDEAKNLRPLIMPDGSPAVEITYIPLKPYDAKEAVNLYKLTKLSELLTLEEFLEAFAAEAEWIEECFASNDIYDLTFEVVHAGDPSPFEAHEENWSELVNTSAPLAIEYENVKYELYVWLHVD